MNLRSLLGARDLPVGVEIHAGGVRMLQARWGRRGGEVRAACDSVVPTGDDGPESDARLRGLADAIEKGLTLGRFAGRSLAVGVDSRTVRVRSVRQTRLPDGDVTRAASLDAPSRLGFTDSEGCEIGWLRAGEVRQGDEARDELLYLGVRREPVERLLGLLMDSGCRIVAVEPSFTALSRCATRTLRRASDEQVCRVLVDIGAVTTDVMVTRGRSIAFYKQLETGGASMTELAAQRLGLDAATVAELRQRRMLAGADASEPKVERAMFDAVRPLINDLAQEITLCLRYYSVTFRGVRPEGVLVFGADAPEPKLAETIGEALNLPVSVAKPLAGVDLSRVGHVIRAGDPASRWGACFGLSTRVLESPSARKAGEWKARAAA